MQFRMVARRAPSGSVTVLGDLAQATGPWTYADWGEVRAHLPTAAPTEHDELTLGYRAPGRVLDFASRLLPRGRPGRQPDVVHPSRSHRPAGTAVGAERAASPLPWPRPQALPADHALVAVIAPEDSCPPSAKLARAQPRSGLLERDAMSRPVTIVPAPAAKGLEFDAVVVVEPAAIAGRRRRGLRLLYVAMTRPIQHLSIVHARPLPEPLVAERSPPLRSPTIRP